MGAIKFTVNKGMVEENYEKNYGKKEKNTKKKMEKNIEKNNRKHNGDKNEKIDKYFLENTIESVLNKKSEDSLRNKKYPKLGVAEDCGYVSVSKANHEASTTFPSSPSPCISSKRSYDEIAKGVCEVSAKKINTGLLQLSC